MSLNTKITEQIRKTQLQAEEIELLKQSFVIVPYQVSGIQDFTNQGAVKKQVRPEDYETFKRIWTGNDAANIQWKDSIYFTKNSTLNDDGTETIDAKIRFQLGDVFLGLLEANSSEVRVQQDVSLTDYTAQDLKQTYTFFVSANHYTITDYHQLMLYKLPEIAGSTLFRISSVEKDYVGRELMSYVITFESINQDFANTGSARQQNIMPSAVGQGYLECKIEDEYWPQRIGLENFNKLKNGVDYYNFYGRYITADFSKTQNRPAKKIVVRQLGLGILSSVACVGRPVQLGENFDLYKQPRLLFPINFTNPSTSNLFHTQQETTNYYFGEFAPTLTSWKNWKDSIKDTYQAGASKWEYEGLLEYNKTEVQKTNPQVGNGYEYDLYGKLVKDATSVKRVPWVFSTTKKSIDTSMVLGCDAKYQIGDRKAIHDHLFDNYWTQKYMKVLPLSKRSNCAMGLLSDILFGGTSGALWEIVKNASIFAIGTMSKWIGRTNPLRYQAYRGIINADFLDMSEMWKTKDGNDALPLDIFKANGNNDNPSNLFFNNNTINTSIEAELTDNFVAKNGRTYTTLNIGQEKDEAGQFLQDNKLPLLLSGSEKLVENSGDGFVIDEVQINSIYNGEYSIEFLDKDNNVIWSSIFQSAGMWANSTRDTWTIRNTSVYGRENVFFDEPFKYPEKLEEPLLALPILQQINTRKNILYCDFKNTSSEAKFFPNPDNVSWLPKSTPKLDNNETWPVPLIAERINYFNGDRQVNTSFINYLAPNKITSPFAGIYKYEVFKYNDVIPNLQRFKLLYPKLNIIFGAEYLLYNGLIKKLGQNYSTKNINEQETLEISTLNVPDIELKKEYQWVLKEEILNGLTYKNFINKIWYSFYEENGALWIHVQVKENEIYNFQNIKYTDWSGDNGFRFRSKEVSKYEFGVGAPTTNYFEWYGLAASGYCNCKWYINFNFVPKI